MVELEFTKKSIGELCPIALKLAARLCADTEGLLLDGEHTMVSVPAEVIRNVKEKAGNPGTVEEIMNYLRIDPWASAWAEGLCKATVGEEDKTMFERCKERLLRHLAERIKEAAGI